MKRSVTILMSTYNGEQYLCQQIDSILHQQDVEINLLVRDDGSTDSTITILDEYATKGLLSWYKGSNIGPAMSFMQLLKDAPPSDYYAFADQDDYWMADKISVAISALQQSDKPSLYFCRTQPVDEHLQPLSSAISYPLLTFGESLVYSIVSGCTMVFNNQLKEVVNSYCPSFVAMHDVWVYIIAQAIGSNIIFDPQPHILYRQHNNNAIGQGYSMLHEMKRRWLRISRHEQVRYHTAVELLQGFSELVTTENLPLLQLFVQSKNNIFKRINLLFCREFRCANNVTWWLFKLSVLLNQY